jgi:hypothetical protein
MSKIFISFSQKDLELHDRLKEALISYGHEVVGVHSLQIGADLSKELNQLLHSADAVVALLTENSIQSKNVINEITVAQAQMDAMGKKAFIPIIVGTFDIPNFLRDTLAEVVPDLSNDNLERVVLRVNQAVEHFKAVRVEKEKSKERLVEKLETSKTEFIREAEERLTKKEKSLRASANLWYSMGYAALLIGVAAAFMLMKESSAGSLETGKVILFAIKGLVGVGLLVALSKYAFTLGKSYMNESLKNSDRLHAISFGKFYLQAYGDVAQPEDVKDVFQHWNIDKDSSFSDLKTDNFDPRIFESAIEIAKVISKNDKEKPKK